MQMVYSKIQTHQILDMIDEIDREIAALGELAFNKSIHCLLSLIHYSDKYLINGFDKKV